MSIPGRSKSPYYSKSAPKEHINDRTRDELLATVEVFLWELSELQFGGEVNDGAVGRIGFRVLKRAGFRCCDGENTMNKQEVLNKFIYRKPDESTRPKLEAVNKAVIDVAEGFFADEEEALHGAEGRLRQALTDHVPAGADRDAAFAYLMDTFSDGLPLKERVQALQAVRMFANSGIVTADRDAESADWCKEGAARAAKK